MHPGQVITLIGMVGVLAMIVVLLIAMLRGKIEAAPAARVLVWLLVSLVGGTSLFVDNPFVAWTLRAGQWSLLGVGIWIAFGFYRQILNPVEGRLDGDTGR